MLRRAAEAVELYAEGRITVRDVIENGQLHRYKGGERAQVGDVIEDSLRVTVLELVDLDSTDPGSTDLRVRHESGEEDPWLACVSKLVRRGGGSDA